MIAEQSIFVDTNVLIYARDQRAGDKYMTAQKWLERLTLADRLIVNLQVLNELTRWVLRTERLSLAAARTGIDMLREFGKAPVTPADVERAWDVRRHLGYQWFDCLLIASAANAGCGHFLSEDMGHGTRYGSLTIINPFRVDPGAFLQTK